MSALLQACLNGARRPADHAALPVGAEALARDARAVRAAGAGAAHLHVKDAAGADTLDAGATDAVVRAVRAAAPGLAVGVTTGAWAAPDPDDRVAAVAAWSRPPDFASVNWHEPGAERVAAAVLAQGADVEAGLWHAEAVAAWRASPLRDRCFRVLLELPDGPDEDATVAEVDRLLGLLDGIDVPVLLHGEGSSCWPALREAGRRGLATRIGLEDTLHLPDGAPAPDNAALVTAARRLLDRD